MIRAPEKKYKFLCYHIFYSKQTKHQTALGVPLDTLQKYLDGQY